MSVPFLRVLLHDRNVLLCGDHLRQCQYRSQSLRFLATYVGGIEMSLSSDQFTMRKMLTTKVEKVRLGLAKLQPYATLDNLEIPKHAARVAILHEGNRRYMNP